MLAAAASSRLGSVLGTGQSVDFATDVAPWLGGRAALALLNTTTSTAGALIVVGVSDQARARSFLRSAGLGARGSYRGHALLSASNGEELALASGLGIDKAAVKTPRRTRRRAGAMPPTPTSPRSSPLSR